MPYDYRWIRHDVRPSLVRPEPAFRVGFADQTSRRSDCKHAVKTPQTQTNRPHGHRGRAWAFASSAGLRHLYSRCAGKSGRQLDHDHGSGPSDGQEPAVRTPNSWIRQPSALAEARSPPSARPGTPIVFWDLTCKPSRPPHGYSPTCARHSRCHSTPGPLSTPRPQCLRSQPSATPLGCRTGTRHPSRHTRRKPAHDVE